jgi:hypothetical protein
VGPVEVEDLRNFTPLSPSLSFVLLRFLPPAIQGSSSAVGEPSSFTPPSLPLRAFLSASSCCLRKSASPSAVSRFTLASSARVLSSTESKNSTSSSSKARNWFLSLFASSNASCLAAGSFKAPLSDQSRLWCVVNRGYNAHCYLYWPPKSRTSSCLRTVVLVRLSGGCWLQSLAVQLAIHHSSR